MNSKILSKKFFVMKNEFQYYDWGSIDAIEELFNIKNAKKMPLAEIWMGAHPKASSSVENFDGNLIPLNELISINIKSILSEKIANKFGGLPFLFKVLSASKALSIQVHPSKEEAKKGFARENDMNIDLSSPVRNYKDPNHKPELVYALTQYEAMNGFRSLEEIIQYFKSLEIEELHGLVKALESNQSEDGLKAFFIDLLQLDEQLKKTAIHKLLAFSNRNKNDLIYSLITRLSKEYPGDIGLFTPLLLNYVVLEPGEAMYLDARTPHSYIRGTSLEVMANSDNVLRAGLTPKHIDVSELACCTSFKHKPFDSLLLTPSVSNDVLDFPVPIDDFKFSIYPHPNKVNISVSSAEIIMPIDDDLIVSVNGEFSVVGKGQSIFIPASTEHYNMNSIGRVARVYN